MVAGLTMTMIRRLDLRQGPEVQDARHVLKFCTFTATPMQPLAQWTAATRQSQVLTHCCEGNIWGTIKILALDPEPLLGEASSPVLFGVGWRVLEAVVLVAPLYAPACQTLCHQHLSLHALTHMSCRWTLTGCKAWVIWQVRVS